MHIASVLLRRRDALLVAAVCLWERLCNIFTLPGFSRLRSVADVGYHFMLFDTGGRFGA